MMGPARRGREKGGTTAEPPTQEKASRGEEGVEDSSRVYLVTIIVLHSPVGHRGADSSYLT